MPQTSTKDKKSQELRDVLVAGGGDTAVCHQLGVSDKLHQNNKPDLFRVACPARGVSKDHHPGTAYFLIAEDASHGQLLQCSSEECAKLKRNFRYCAVCKRPVSKRNFHTRHDHGFVRYNDDGKAILPSMAKIMVMDADASDNDKMKGQENEAQVNLQLAHPHQTKKNVRHREESSMDEKGNAESPRKKTRPLGFLASGAKPTQLAVEQDALLPEEVYCCQMVNTDMKNSTSGFSASGGSGGDESSIDDVIGKKNKELDGDWMSITTAEPQLNDEERMWLDLYRKRPQGGTEEAKQWLKGLYGLLGSSSNLLATTVQEKKDDEITSQEGQQQHDTSSSSSVDGFNCPVVMIRDDDRNAGRLMETSTAGSSDDNKDDTIDKGSLGDPKQQRNSIHQGDVVLHGRQEASMEDLVRLPMLRSTSGLPVYASHSSPSSFHWNDDYNNDESVAESILEAWVIDGFQGGVWT